MKTKSILIALALALSITSTVFAENNEETSEQFYNRQSAAYYVTGDYVRVRTHPSTDGFIIRELRKGEFVKSFNYDSAPHEDETGMKWHYILMKDGSVGWVCADFLELRE